MGSRQTIGMAIQHEPFAMLQEAWQMSHSKSGESNTCPDHPLCSRNNAHSISK